MGDHALRKTAITNSLRNGAPIAEAPQLAGHSDIRTTQLYYKPSAKHAEDAARHIQIRRRPRKGEPFVTTRSTETQQFDVFLSHNSREKPAVEALAYRLRAEGLNPWLDKERLIEGERWQAGLAEGLRASSTCAIFIGKDDLGNGSPKSWT